VFVGHLAVALSAKRVTPRAPLVALTSAAFGLDLLWPIFVLAGLETVRIDPGNTAFTPLDFVSYPWSHSLLMSVVWGAAAAALAARSLRDSRAGFVVGALVVSHWILDVVVHRPDLPVWPGGPKVGLGLWNSIPATLILEGVMLAAGVAIYARAAPARDATGRWTFRALVLLCAVLWAWGPFSPPPPTPVALATVGLIFGLLTIPWTIWIERHRGSAR
jgi:hypothetical protein